MFDGFPNINEASYNKWRKAIREGLRKIFGDKINNNFLFEMVDLVSRNMMGEIFKYFEIHFDEKTSITGRSDSQIDYEIARNIVGIHRFNTCLLSDFERHRMEQDEKYRKDLLDEVITHIKIRRYSGIYFRNTQFFYGEEFLYYPLAYKLFAASMKGLEMLLSTKKKSNLSNLLYECLNKCLAALSLLEDNFLDSAYSQCRAAIELCIRSFVLSINKEVIPELYKFADFDVRKTQCDIHDDKEYKEKFKTARFKTARFKGDYLHYGWVDKIEDYNSSSPYSFKGLMEYIESNNKYEQCIRDSMVYIYELYNKCHSYTHAIIGQTRIPILHYQEITTMLFFVVNNILELINRTYDDVDKMIDDIDICYLCELDYDKLCEKRDLFSNENFDKYYKFKSK